MEGGYNINELGVNVVNVLQGFEDSSCQNYESFFNDVFNLNVSIVKKLRKV